MPLPLSRAMWRTMEPYHGVVYYAPEGPERYGELGITGRAGYFASRGAALGRVPGSVVNAAFFGHHPNLVSRHVPRVWELASPELVVAARFEVADRSLQRTMPEALESPAMVEAADLAVEACGACGVEGRALFAGNRAIPFPSPPHLALWHATTQLREYRGDGHNAVNLAVGLTAGETLALHAAELGRAGEGLKRTREWPDDEWAAARSALMERGLLTVGGELTVDGRALRAEIEDRTDELASAPYRHLGEERSRRLRELIRPFSKAVVESGTFGPPSDPVELAKWGIPLPS